VKETIDAGATIKEVWEDHFPQMVRYNKNLTQYHSMMTSARTWKMEIYIYVGPTETGKTRTAYDLYGQDLYSLPQSKGSGTYWDGYHGQETVLIDEMYGNRFSWGFLLQLLDR
jgi:hypothetical protein